MKAFRFRLDQALRWRAAQRDVEKSKVAAAAQCLSEIRAELDLRGEELRDATRQLGPVISGSSLENLSAFSGKTRRRISELEKSAARAEQDLAAKTSVMLEANRKLRLMENLKQTELAHWQEDFSRELEAFASDSFLGRLQSKQRARSSSG